MQNDKLQCNYDARYDSPKCIEFCIDPPEKWWGGGGDTNFDSKALYCSSAHTIFSLPFVFFGILVVQFTPRSFPLSLSLHVLLWICDQGIVLKEERAIPQLNQ